MLENVWSFASVFVIAWITSRITLYWEKKKKVEETKLSIFLSWIPFFAECYACSIDKSGPQMEKRNFIRKKMEILGILQITGPGEAMESFLQFCSQIEKAQVDSAEFDAKELHFAFTELNARLCCDIHGARQSAIEQSK